MEGALVGEPLQLKGHTKFTTSGAHDRDVIEITSLQKKDLCTEELIDENLQTLDKVSLPHRKARFCLFLGRERVPVLIFWYKIFTLGGCFSLE